MNSIVKKAFKKSLPIMAGYMILGMGYGILMNVNGYGFWWALIMSIFVYAGSMQYVAVTLLTAAFNPIYSFFLTLLVNARHIFYGISMLKKYEGMGKIKPYLIFGLTDETFSVLATDDFKNDFQGRKYVFFVTVLNQIYWITGSVIGSLLGNVITFDTRGIDFSLTALFVVIFTEQFKKSDKRITGIIGIICSAFCLLIFGTDNFILLAMALIILCLAVFKGIIEKGDIR